MLTYILQFISTLLATLIGVYIAFRLNELSNNKRKKEIYLSLLRALESEFENNRKLIENESGVGVSFETFKMVVSNEIFVSGTSLDNNLDSNFIELLWEVISELRKVKDFDAFNNYKSGQYCDFNKFKDVHNEIKNILRKT